MVGTPFYSVRLKKYWYPVLSKTQRAKKIVEERIFFKKRFSKAQNFLMKLHTGFFMRFPWRL